MAGVAGEVAEVRADGAAEGTTGGGGFVGVARAGAPAAVATTAGGAAEGDVVITVAGVSGAARTSGAAGGTGGAKPLSVGCASGISGKAGAIIAAGGTNAAVAEGPGGAFEGNDVGFDGDAGAATGGAADATGDGAADATTGGGAAEGEGIAGRVAAARVGSTGGIDGARGRLDGTGGGSGRSSRTSRASAGTGGLRLRPVPVFEGSVFGFAGDDEIGGGGVAAMAGLADAAAVAPCTIGAAFGAAGTPAVVAGLSADAGAPLIADVFGALDALGGAAAGATAAGGGVGAETSFFEAAEPFEATAGGEGVGAALEGVAPPSAFFVIGDGSVDGDGNADFPPSAAGNAEVFPLPPSALGSGSEDNGRPPEGSPGEIEGWLARGGVDGAPPGRSPEGDVPSPLAGPCFPSDFAVMKSRSKTLRSFVPPARTERPRSAPCRGSADGPMILGPRAVACQLPRKKGGALRRIARTKEFRPHRKA